MYSPDINNGLKRATLKTALLTGLFSVAALSQTALAQTKVIGYIPTYKNMTAVADATDFKKLTHINLAFLNIPASGVVANNGAPTCMDNVSAADITYVVQKAHQAGAKVLVSLAGAAIPGCGGDWANLLKPAMRTTVVNNLIQFINASNLDGIDVDIEGELLTRIDNAGNYTPFIQALKNGLGNKLVTSATGSYEGGMVPISSLPFFDFVNIMSYDLIGPSWGEAGDEHSPYSMAVSDINVWKARGLPKEKLILGLPAYGYGFNGFASDYDYNTIIAEFGASAAQNDVISTRCAGCSYITYNGLPTIRQKTQLALQQGGGVMIWELAGDTHDATSILNAVSTIVGTNPSSSSSSNSSVAGGTITVQAENYATMNGVQLETTTDVGGGQNVGYIETNDWITYNNITVPVAGKYTIAFRVASESGGGLLQFEQAGGGTIFGSSAIASTGGWQNWTTVYQTVTLNAGTQSFGIKALAGGWNINWFSITPVAASSSSKAVSSAVVSSALSSIASSVVASSKSSAVVSSSSIASVTSSSKSSVVSSAVSSSKSSVIVIPSSSSVANTITTVQAENYATMNGVQLETTTDAGGGQNVGYIDTNDWFTYNNINIPASGKYVVSFRVASETSGGKLQFEQSGGGTIYGSATIPVTGGWQTWTTVSQTVTLTAGVQSFGIKALTGGWNINWFSIAPVTGSASSVSSVASSVKSSAVSSIVVSSATSSSKSSSSSSSTGAFVNLDDAAKKDIAMQIVSTAENSSTNWRGQFTYIQDIKDGRGYTAGIIGFCSGTSDMLQLVENYTKKFPTNGLAKYLPALRNVNGSESHAGLDPNYPADWKKEAQNVNFQNAQETERDNIYFNPSVKIGKSDGIRALGQFAYYDAAVVHGYEGMLDVRTRAMKRAKTPAQGGNEVTYLNAFLDERVIEMKKEAAHEDTTRIDTAQRVFLNNGNLDLNTPLSWKVYGDSYSIAKSAGAQNVTTLAVAASSSSTSSSNTAITVQAETYAAMNGVQLETTTDTGGGLYVGWIDANDWMTYDNVTIPAAGNYTISYRVASLAGGGRLQFEQAGGATIYGDIDIPATGDWQTWTTVSHTVALKAGVQSFGIKALSGGLNINWFKISAVANSSEPASSSVKSVSSVSTSSAVNSSIASSSSVVSSAVTTSTASSIKPSSSSVKSSIASSTSSIAVQPVKVEVETYATMNGIQLETTTDVGGGQFVGWIDANDWITYNNVNIPAAGTYIISYRVASLSGSGRVQFEKAGGTAIYGALDIPATGGWQNWVTVSHTVTLQAGAQSFGLKALTGGWNINWFSITPSGISNPSSSSSSSSSSTGTGKARLVAYLPDWSGSFGSWANTIDFTRMTHLNLSFGNPQGSDHRIVMGQSDADINALVTKAHQAGVKVLVSVAGGSGSDGFSTHYGPATVDALVQQIDIYLTKFNLDGVDVDVEAPDKMGTNYRVFVQKLMATLKPKNKLVTAAVAPWMQHGMDDATLRSFDFINIMSYMTYQIAQNDLNYYVNEKKVPRDKAVLGVAFYGDASGCAKGYYLYKEILAKYPDAWSKDIINDGGCRITYTGEATMKRDVALGEQYGGVMFWELSGDASGNRSLYKIIQQTIH